MKVCFECGNTADIEHHVIPRSKGGNKTVPLCNNCHSLVHDAKLFSTATLSLHGKEIVKKLKNQQKIIEMFLDGEQISKIAKTIGIGRAAVYHILEEHGLHENEGKGCEFKVTPDLLDQIKDMREEGSSWEKIEEKLDICHTHLFRIIKEFGWSDKKYNTVSKNRKEYRTLTKEKIKQAEELRSQNKTWDEIAETLNVDRTTFYKHGLAQQYKPLRGQLTDDKKQLAIKLKLEGKTWKEIANLLEVSLSAIYMAQVHKL
jgi:DNA invertase Pin-like site-specific DNA recombinase